MRRHGWLSLLVVPALALAGCGRDADPSAEPGTPSAPTSGATGSHQETGTEPQLRNEPDATPADELPGATVDRGAFTVLDTAPPGSDAVTGRAWLARSEQGTTVTIRLRGLEPDTEYRAHLHEQRCGEDNGGEHFTFDPAGSDEPPNEVHLGFVTDDQGRGEATVTHERRVGDGAPSVVVHPGAMMDNRVACANF